MKGMTNEARVQEFTHNFILFEFENAGLQKCYEFPFVKESYLLEQSSYFMLPPGIFLSVASFVVGKCRDSENIFLF